MMAFFCGFTARSLVLKGKNILANTNTISAFQNFFATRALFR